MNQHTDNNSILRLTSDKDIDAIVSRLRATFKSGKTRPLTWRLSQLKAMLAMLNENGKEFIQALEDDTGRPSFEAWTGDLMCAVNEITSMLKGVKKWMKPRRLKTPLEFFPSRAYSWPDPLGVTLLLAPWNYPLELILNPLAGAVSGGNCAICKPSEIAPQTSTLLAKYIPKYLDTDAIAVVEGGVPETTTLLTYPFDHIFYTGNGKVGKIILKAAAEYLTPVTLELGGKSPCIVTRKANLDVSVNRLCFGKFYNAGQTCVAPDYILVEKVIEEEFLEKVRQTIILFYNNDPKNNPDFGHIVNEHHFKRLEALLQGQKFFIGGEMDIDRLYIAPTVIRDVQPDNALMEDEIFGPIMPVLSVADLDEAIEFCNERPKPLALSLFSQSKKELREILTRTTAGGVDVNTALLHSGSPHIPFGGVGASGMGTYHGAETFNTFSHLKSVLQQGTWTELLSQMALPPYSKFKWYIARKVSGVK